MDLDLFRAVLPQMDAWKPLQGLCFHLGGEPLAHPALEKMVALAAERGHAPGFNTNGSLLTAERIEALLAAGLAGVRIDFSADRDYYEKARAGARWEKVHANICHLADYRDRVRPEFSIILKDLRLERGLTAREREASIEALRNVFRGVRIDQFDSFELHNWSSEYASMHPIEEPAGRSRPATNTPCSHLWFTLNMKHDGRIVPCCRDLWGEQVVGNAMDEDLMDIWNGERMQTLRRLHVVGRSGEVDICRDCDRPVLGGKRGGSPAQIVGKYARRIARSLRARAHMGASPS